MLMMEWWKGVVSPSPKRALLVHVMLWIDSQRQLLSCCVVIGLFFLGCHVLGSEDMHAKNIGISQVQSKDQRPN